MAQGKVVPISDSKLAQERMMANRRNFLVPACGLALEVCVPSWARASLRTTDLPASTSLDGSSLAATALFAHRGHWRGPDNTAAAVAAACTEPNLAGVEIDIQLLNDGKTWALTHDLVPMSGIQNIRQAPISMISPDEWKRAVVSDRRESRRKAPAATLDDALRSYSNSRRPDFKLVLDLKGFATERQIEPLLEVLSARMTPGSYRLTAFYAESIASIYRLDPKVDRAWVVLSPGMVARALPLEARMAFERYAPDLGVTLQDAQDALRAGDRFFSKETSPAALTRALGDGCGLALPIESTVRATPVLKQFLDSGFSVSTYSESRNDALHAASLRKIWGEIPDLRLLGAFIDGDAASFRAIASGQPPIVETANQGKLRSLAQMPKPLPPSTRSPTEPKAPIRIDAPAPTR